MKNLTFVLFVVLVFGLFFITCQEAMSPDQISQDSDPPNVESCIEPPPPCPPPEPPACGRMTGGGSVFFGEDPRVRVTRGFEIHCDLSDPNNLQVNWQGGNKFHLSDLQEADCIDTDVVQDPPAAPFDTFIGVGVGRLNKEENATIHFTFVDAGEPGKNDWASIEIWAPGSDPDTDDPVLSVAGFIEVGNLQAHDDKCN